LAATDAGTSASGLRFSDSFSSEVEEQATEKLRIKLSRIGDFIKRTSTVKHGDT
jgi:hypothetical protein